MNLDRRVWCPFYKTPYYRAEYSGKWIRIYNGRLGQWLVIPYPTLLRITQRANDPWKGKTV